MERCDFSAVMAIVRRYIGDDHNLSQTDLLYLLFESFIVDTTDFYFDNGLVCRWMKGLARISPRITGYYRKNNDRLAGDFLKNVSPLLYDSSMAAQEIYQLLVRDCTISQQVKQRLSDGYPYQMIEAEGRFITAALYFGMEREFIKRDSSTNGLLVSGNLSPVVCHYILGCDVPKPCRHFCGREKELETLHATLSEHGKVFLCGIAGIGKSEVMKAYARRYQNSYRNMIYLSYSGDLQKDIANMDFADDLPKETPAERFQKHNRFLRTLKEDTLLVIDNFNTTASTEQIFSVVMNYHCKILFTTRCRFEEYEMMELGEIEDKEVLLQLAGCFFTEAASYRGILEQIIDTVHHHTLAVELASRLLQSGILEPLALLQKLREQKTSMDASDQIRITKDGQAYKATYYDHIHTLFSLYQLEDDRQEIMRALVFTPAGGIHIRLLAHWMQLNNTNLIHDLIETGFILTLDGQSIALHPMLLEVTMTESPPTVTNCRRLLSGLQHICLYEGEDISYDRQMFETVETVTYTIQNDDMATYLLFLENAFPYMKKYGYSSGMERMIEVLSEQLKDSAVGTNIDRALLLDFRAVCEENPQKAVELRQRAVEIPMEITPEKAHLVARLYGNLGCTYKLCQQTESAKNNLERCMRLFLEFELYWYDELYMLCVSYAVILCDLGYLKDAHFILEVLIQSIKQVNNTTSMTYASLQEIAGGFSLMMYDKVKAREHFEAVLACYGERYGNDPHILSAKKDEIYAMYQRSGIYLAKQIQKHMKK